MTHADRRARSARTPRPWEAEFLANLEKTYNPAAAARKVKKTRHGVFKRREISPRFARAWDEIMEAVRDSLEASALEKAINGWLEPIYYKGVPVGAKRVFSPGLTIFMLKCHRPERYNIKDNETAASATADDQARAVMLAVAEMNRTMEARAEPASGAQEPEGGVPATLDVAATVTAQTEKAALPALPAGPAGEAPPGGTRANEGAPGAPGG